jgi:hypothetical protein
MITSRQQLDTTGYRPSISFSGLCSTVIAANHSAGIEGENRDEMVIWLLRWRKSESRIMLLRFNNQKHGIQNVFSRGFASINTAACCTFSLHISSRLPTGLIIMHRDLFNADMSNPRQRFGLHHAVYLLSDTLSADGSHIYGVDERQLPQASVTQESFSYGG